MPPTTGLPEGAGTIEVQLDAPQARLIVAPQAAASRFEEANMTVVAIAAAALYLMVMAVFIWRSRRLRSRPNAVQASVTNLADGHRAAAD
jgi:hypothetical protein